MTIIQILKIAEQNGKRTVHLSHSHSEIRSFESAYRAKQTRNKYGKNKPMFDITVTLFETNRKTSGGKIVFTDPI